MSIAYPNIDPVAFSIGPLPIRWYALGYIAGIGLSWWYISGLLKNTKLWSDTRQSPLSKEQLDDIVFWVAIGIMAGGRIGYVLFYEPNLLVEPWRPLGATMAPGLIKTIVGWLPIPPALMLWRGGMSFHGGLIGVTLAGILFCRRNALNPLQIGDLFAAAAPIGIGLVRIANFINGELYGRAWNGPWSMIFPNDPLQVPRHPSQLYEAFLEGVVLFFVVRVATHHFRSFMHPGATIGVFLSGYAACRIFVENFRQPDAHLPNFPLGLTMGMMLSLPMLALGGWLIYSALKKSQASPDGSKA
ncbi:MAG: prolipoprotein diacylglyceryl transferase [Pseudomonadota bacterium]